VIGWKPLVVATVLSTLFTIAMDKLGVITKLAALLGG